MHIFNVERYYRQYHLNSSGTFGGFASRVCLLPDVILNSSPNDSIIISSSE